MNWKTAFVVSSPLALILLVVAGCAIAPALKKDTVVDSPSQAVAAMSAVSRIEGTVTFKAGDPAGIDVSAYPVDSVPGGTTYATKTDKAGHYSLAVPGGTYNVIASKVGSAYRAVQWAVQAATIVDLDLTPTGTIRGAVQASAPSNLTGLLVFVPGTSFLAATEASGNYTMTLVPVGTVTIEVLHEGYAPATASVAVQAGQITVAPLLFLQATGQSTSFDCMTCHGDRTALGEKVQNARDSWKTSVHALGFLAALVDGTGTVIALENEGADSFYANGGGCQVCHTKEGFNKKVDGVYTSASPASSDTIQAPSSLTCFTCHKPHSNGNFDLVVPAASAATLISGAVYSKNKGSLCASCHMARTPASGGAAYALSSIRGSGLSASWGPHHGPQADLLLGKAGAEYTGKTYGNGAHTSLQGADCITCHMLYPATRAAGSPNLAGHSFNAVGIVHGVEKGNVAGCVICHDATLTKALSVGASGALQAKGHLHVNDAYFTLGKAEEHYAKMNDLLIALVNPDATGSGLLQAAYELPTVAGAGKTISWSKDGRYMPTTESLKDPAATADSPKVRFAMALYNYKFVLEDKSFGVHNNVYASQLLWDSCEDLIALTGATASIGTRP